MSALSTPDAAAITRSIDVDRDTATDHLSIHDFDIFYDIQQTVLGIQEGDYKRIALQFPDELLHDSVPIYRRLKEQLGSERQLYILADTSYGSCCVDEVAAQHVNADIMVHYGHACMSLTSRLPVIYIFGRKPLDIDDCISKLVDIYKSHSSDSNPSSDPHSKKIALFKHEVQYTHLADDILQKLRKELEPLNVTVLYNPIQPHTSPTSTSIPTSKSSAFPSNPNNNTNTNPQNTYTIIFYIGTESLTLTNLLMTHAFCNVFSYDPITLTTHLESTKTNKLLMRRYAMVQKARDSDVFGILVGTLGVASYLPLISHLRSILSKSHKKSYTISVGKPTPSKLANFLEIECFVVVACFENSLIESPTSSSSSSSSGKGGGGERYFKPVVTPFELEIALGVGSGWSGRYVLDFDQVIADGSSSSGGGVEDKGKGKCEGERKEGEKDEEVANNPEQEQEDEEGEDEDEDRPQFSLITGTYRHPKRYGTSTTKTKTETGNGNGEMILRNQDNQVVVLSDSAAGDYLQNQRTFKGLEVRYGLDLPSVLEQGRSGIARGYQTDNNQNQNQDQGQDKDWGRGED